MTSSRAMSTWSPGALGNYTSDILDLAEEGNKVFGKIRFHSASPDPSRDAFDRPSRVVVW